METRRAFLQKLGLAAVGVAVVPALEEMEQLRRFFPSAAFPEQRRLIATFDALVTLNLEDTRITGPSGQILRRELRYGVDWNHARMEEWKDPMPMPEGRFHLRSVEEYDGPRRLRSLDATWTGHLQYDGHAKLQMITTPTAPHLVGVNHSFDALGHRAEIVLQRLDSSERPFEEIFSAE